MTTENERDFQNSSECHICERRFKPKDLVTLDSPPGNGDNSDIMNKVRDHCHITGEYRGAAHRDCNLKWVISPEKLKIPVIFHNLKGYDCHFIMQKIGDLIRRDVNINVGVIASNFEKYIGFRLGNHLTFIDSFSFMSQSLDRLSSNLSDNAFIYSKEAFYSILNDTNISELDYEHAKKVWSVFKIRDLGEYHDLYLKTDVLLLADVFESFRKTCLEYYKLDPYNYFSAPGLSWDALLRMTKINLDLISDVDQQLFIEKECVAVSLI